MVDTVQISVETDIIPSTNSTVHMERIISTMLKELNVMKPITGNIDTSNSVTISTVTGEGNTTMTPKESSVKEASDNNTNTTVTNLQDSTSDNSSYPTEETDKMEETSTLL
eukprot:4961177-Ditylum_brightwellii.AAC.1